MKVAAEITMTFAVAYLALWLADWAQTETRSDTVGWLVALGTVFVGMIPVTLCAVLWRRRR